MCNWEIFISCRTPSNLRPIILLLRQNLCPTSYQQAGLKKVINRLRGNWVFRRFCLVISHSVFSPVVQTLLKDMVIIADLRPRAFAALQTVKFHYKIARSVGSIVLQRRTCLLQCVRPHPCSAEHPQQDAQVVLGLADGLKRVASGRTEWSMSPELWVLLLFLISLLLLLLQS